MEHKMLTISVQDINGSSINLNKIISKKISGGESFAFQAPGDFKFGEGNFVFWSDAQMKNTSKKGEEILVQGFENDILVFSQNMKVGHDCCHVVKLEGPETIEIEVNP